MRRAFRRASARPSTSTTAPDDLALGPGRCASTAGTQYVTATAGGSPSGHRGHRVHASTAGRRRAYSGASAQVPVSGIGTHTVSCYAQDNAVDPSGAHGTSTTATWSLKIGQPTVVGIAFDKLVGLRCHRRARAREGSRALDHRSPARQAREGQDAGAHADRARDALPSTHRAAAHRGVRAACVVMATWSRSSGSSSCAWSCLRMSSPGRREPLPSGTERPSTAIWAPLRASRSAVTP